MLNCIKIHNYTVPGTLVNSSVSLPLLARWPRHATLPTNSGCVVAMHGPYKQNGFLQTNLFSVHFLSLTTRQKLEKHHSRLLHHTNISVEKRKTHKREWFISQSRALKCEKTRDMYLQESGSRHRTISMGRSSRPADNRANLTSPTGLPTRTEHSMLFGRSVRSLKKKKICDAQNLRRHRRHMEAPVRLWHSSVWGRQLRQLHRRHHRSVRSGVVPSDSRATVSKRETIRGVKPYGRYTTMAVMWPNSHWRIEHR